MNEGLDLFDSHTEQPDILRDVTEGYSDILENSERDSAEVCKEFLLAVEKLGYTFEYGLDFSPYNLRPIVRNKFERGSSFEP